MLNMTCKHTGFYMNIEEVSKDQASLDNTQNVLILSCALYFLRIPKKTALIICA